jgi:NDP-sugar pyrophosphorylase family protein
MSDPDLPPVAILAGGLATRLRPITEKIPKSLVEVAGRPFLWHQLKLLESRGIREAILCAGYLGEMIQREAASFDCGVQLRFSFDGERLLGTGGALRRAVPLLPETFFVLYGDSYLLCDYRAAADTFRRSRKRGLMTVYRNEGRFDTSNVEYANGQIMRYQKNQPDERMLHIDYGLGMFHREVFEGLPDGQFCDLAGIYVSLLREEQLAAFEVRERFYEIGSPQGLREAEAFLASPRS